MPWFTKKERRRQVSAFPAIFKADFDCFRHVSAVFRPVSAASWYDSIWSIRPDFGRISLVRRESKPIRRESKPIWHESSRVDANPRKKKKKKKKRRCGSMCGQLRWTPRPTSDASAAPLVPRPCFLACETFDPIIF